MPKDASGLAVIRPGRSGQIASRDALDVDALRLSHQKAAPEQLGRAREAERFELRRVFDKGDEVVRHNVARLLEPEGRKAAENGALVRDAGRQDDVEGGDTVSRDHEEIVAEVVHVPHLATMSEAREFSLEDEAQAPTRSLAV